MEFCYLSFFYYFLFIYFISSMSQNANNSKGQTKVSSTKASTNNNTLDKTQTAASLQPIAAEKLKVRKKKKVKKN